MNVLINRGLKLPVKYATDRYPCGSILSLEILRIPGIMGADPDLIRSRRHYTRNTVAVALNNAIQRSPGASRPIEIPYTRCILTKEYPVISRLIRTHLPDGREQVDA